MANQSRYRTVNWLGGRILEARELMTFQAITDGVDASGNKVVYDLDQLYTNGSTQNISLSIVGRTVSFGPSSNGIPMAIFVRGRWEVFQTSDLPPITLSTTQQSIFLNYSIDIVTYNGAGGTLTDGTLIDTTTGQPTAEMGQIDFVIGAVDTSGVGLNSALQLEKNTVPIELYRFTTGSSPNPMVQIQFEGNVNPACLATQNSAGLVYLSTSTNINYGIAVGAGDPRLSDPRVPIASSVSDVSVSSPSPFGVNPRDGSSMYSNVGSGIGADKIVYLEATERLSDYLLFLYNQILAASSSGVISFNSRSGVVTPQAGDYTAAMVGAAASSHVGLGLVAATSTGTILSHPATVTVPSSGAGGYALNQPSGVTNGPIPWGSIPALTTAYGIFQSGSPVAGITNYGDFFSNALSSTIASPGGTPIHYSGPLVSLWCVAQVLADHVNQTTGYNNPHGITQTTLGISASSLGINAGSLGFSTGSNGNGYWSKDPFGNITQWGEVSTDINGGTLNVTFPMAFTSRCNMVIVTTLASNDRITYVVNGSPSIYGFTIGNNGSGGYAYWESKGV